MFIDVDCVDWNMRACDALSKQIATESAFRLNVRVRCVLCVTCANIRDRNVCSSSCGDLQTRDKRAGEFKVVVCIC